MSSSRRSSSRPRRRRTTQGIGDETELDRLNGLKGLELHSPMLGDIKLSTSFITHSLGADNDGDGKQDLAAEVRLMIICPEDLDGELGMELTEDTHKIKYLNPHHPAGMLGLFRLGDRVVGCDGTLIGHGTTLREAMLPRRREHVLIITRVDPVVVRPTCAAPTSPHILTSAHGRRPQASALTFVPDSDRALANIYVAQLLSAPLVVPPPPPPKPTYPTIS